MEVRRSYIVTALVLSFGLLTLVLAVLPALAAPSAPRNSLYDTETAQPARGVAADLHVATTGTDSGDCTDSDFPCQAVQYALGQASEGSTIKMASGVYTDLNVRPVPSGYPEPPTSGLITQVVYISKTVTIRGGYTTTDWSEPHPISHPTTLDAQGQGRVVYIGAGITVTLEGLRLMHGNGSGLGGGSGTFTDAGGGFHSDRATAILSDCLIAANRSPKAGGGFVNRGTFTLYRSVITANQAISANAGGIFIYNPLVATLSQNTVSSNSSSFNGGGLYLAAGYSDTLLLENVIVSNTASHDGGGVFVASYATLIGNQIMSNTAGFNGGGLFVNGRSPLIASNRIVGNRASYYGGGVYTSMDAADLRANQVLSNSAQRSGGGLYLRDSQGVLENSIVARNRAGDGYSGAGTYAFGGSPRFLHTTFAQNVGGDGTGVYLTDALGEPGTAALTNTVLVSHTVGMYVASGSTATLEATLWATDTWANHADWGGPGKITTGTVNIWGDPGFADPDNGDYHIHAKSAAINAGVDAGVTEDMDGDPRTDGRPDLGADELMVSLIVAKQADPDPAEAGKQLMYTIRITNTGEVGLHATITDTLPFSVTLGKTSGSTLLPPGGMMRIIWTAAITAPGGIWTETIVVTVAEDYEGPLTNLVEVTTEEGARGIYTETVAVVTESTIYLPLIARTRPVTIATGEYLLVGAPCTTVPCLPGMVYAVLVDDRRYYPTVDDSWLWWNRPWDGYLPEIGDFVTVSGYAEEMTDTFGIRFYNIEVTSLGLTYRPPTTTRAIVISEVLSYGDEYVEIRNDDTQSIPLDSWTLNNSDNRTFTFPDYLMQPGEVCRVYTNQEHPEWCGFTYVSESDVWDSAQGCAYLRDGEGVLIDAYCYCNSHTAYMTISATDTTVEVGELVTVTTTLFNRGCTLMGIPYYRLYVESEEPEPIFDPSHPEPVSHELGIGRGQSDTAEFVLKAVRPGQATLRGTASFEVHLGYPGPAYWGYSVTGPLMVTVTQ
jgi:uncharacterized repeat protein (TIGR01451 family)